MFFAIACGCCEDLMCQLEIFGNGEMRSNSNGRARAKEILATESGCPSYRGEAAVAAGRRSDEAVSMLVKCFNQEGLGALAPHGGGGRKLSYDTAARERILAEARRTPDPKHDGTGTWSLMSLRRALRPMALPVSAPTRSARCCGCLRTASCPCTRHSPGRG